MRFKVLDEGMPSSGPGLARSSSHVLSGEPQQSVAPRNRSIVYT